MGSGDGMRAAAVGAPAAGAGACRGLADLRKICFFPRPPPAAEPRRRWALRVAGAEGAWAQRPTAPPRLAQVRGAAQNLKDGRGRSLCGRWFYWKRQLPTQEGPEGADPEGADPELSRSYWELSPQACYPDTPPRSQLRAASGERERMPGIPP
jgi:hypothetical protein